MSGQTSKAPSFCTTRHLEKTDGQMTKTPPIHTATHIHACAMYHAAPRADRWASDKKHHPYTQPHTYTLAMYHAAPRADRRAGDKKHHPYTQPHTYTLAQYTTRHLEQTGGQVTKNTTHTRSHTHTHWQYTTRHLVPLSDYRMYVLQLDILLGDRTTSQSPHPTQYPNFVQVIHTTDGEICSYRHFGEKLLPFNYRSRFVCALVSNGHLMSPYYTRKTGPRWQSVNTLTSHLWGRGSVPGTASSGKAGSCLPLVGSLQYRNLDTPTVCTGFLRPSNYPSLYDLFKAT